MGVRIQAGTMRLPAGTAPANFWYEAAVDTANPGEALTVTTANPSNPRRDLVVAYIDKAVTPTTSVTNNSNNILKLAVVAGTPASTPSDPTSSQITTAIGASNPYIVLARIAVGTGVTQITNSDITDLRQFMGIPTFLVSRQNDVTNLLERRARILSGWGAIPVGGMASGAEAVNFSTPFTTRPIITLTSGGDHPSATTYGSGAINLKQFFSYAVDASPTGFTAIVRSADGSAWPAGADAFYQWMAIGE